MHNKENIYDLNIHDLVNTSGLSLVFIARRLHEQIGFEYHNSAAQYLSHMVRDTGYLPGDFTEMQHMKNRALLLYAVGAPKNHPEVKKLTKKGIGYPPKKGISYNKLMKLREAMKSPASADSELLIQLDLDEKMNLLEPGTNCEIETVVDKLIRSRRLKDETNIAIKNYLRAKYSR